MDFEEFQESDVMFSLAYSWDQIKDNENGGSEIHGHRHSQGKSTSLSLPRNEKKEKQQRMSSPMSLPINIPTGMGFSLHDFDLEGREPSDQSSSDEDQDDQDDEIYERLPPHLIVERRDSGEIVGSFSPLKSRQLYQVRNSVLRMTGFLER